MALFSEQAKLDRKLCQRSLYYLCKEVLGYKDMVPHVHGELCHFQTHPKYGRFRQSCVPRSWFKTWVCTVGKSIWLTLPDEEGLYKDIYPYKGPDVRILIGSNVIDNSAKMVNKIKSEWERNDRLQAAFPEIVPDFNKTRWSDHCAEVRRQIKATEGTYTAVGAGGSVVSQHFDHIIEDDLVYAKKDDFSGQELMPNQEDIDNAIGWHKLAFSLLANPQTGCIDNTGTRWAPHDIVDFIRKHEPHYQLFEISVTKEALWPVPDDSYTIWPERYNLKTLEQIRNSQGNRIFETQYLNRPRAGEDVTFEVSYLNRHESLDEFPDNLSYETYVDLAGWKDSKKLCRNVVITGAKDNRNHYWISRCDVGRFTPTEVIDLIKQHQVQFNSKVKIEEVGYQVALRHFAVKDMESEGSTWYDISQIPPDNRKGAKELRINSVQPVVKNGALHILGKMTDLITEMEDYPYGATKDILDTLGFIIRHAQVNPETVRKDVVNQFSREAIEEEFYNKSRRETGYPFPYQLKYGDIHR